MFHEDDKFIPANASDDVGAAELFFDSLRCFDQDGIAKEMPHAVIDLLEIIQIENHQCGTAVFIQGF